MRRALQWSLGGGLFLMSEVTLYGRQHEVPTVGAGSFMELGSVLAGVFHGLLECERQTLLR